MTRKGVLCALALTMVLPSVLSFSLFYFGNSSEPLWATAKDIYSFNVTYNQGEVKKMNKYKGLVLIIVNIPYRCSYGSKYIKMLNKLYTQLYDKGVRIIGFPCDQLSVESPYGGFETQETIGTFIEENNIKFDVFDKIDVNGDNTNDLWHYLKLKGEPHPNGVTEWNYTIYVVDRKGKVTQKFIPLNSFQELRCKLNSIL